MIRNLTINEWKLRKVYLSKIAKGEIYGPMVGKLSVDMPWLKYYSEKQIMAETPEMTIYEYMKKDVDNYPDITALEYFGKKITFQQLIEKIDDCAKSMIKNGIKSESIVTICMGNTPEAVIAFYALNKIGAVAHMIHPFSAEDEIKSFVIETNSQYIFTIDSSYNKFKNIQNEANIKEIVVISPKDSMPLLKKMAYTLFLEKSKVSLNDKSKTWNNFVQQGKDVSFVEDDKGTNKKDKVAVILRTGGTTGTPKGAMITNHNFNSMVDQFKQSEDNFSVGDKMLTIMPVFHGFGLCSSIHLPLSLGVTSVLIPKVDIKNFHKLFKKVKPNHLLGVPTLFQGIINNKKMKNIDMSCLKYAVSGGDMLKDQFEEKVNSFFATHNSKAKLCKGYGLAEAVAGVTFASKDYNAQSSIGIPMVNTNIKIVSIDTKEELTEGEVGEICVSGETVMKGYYNKREETDRTIRENWLHTGDLGYYKDGQFYFSSRKGDMIVVSGINVYPIEIEKIIESHPAVSICAVIGVSHPYKMEIPKAYIVLKEGFVANDEIKQELKRLCEKKLNKYAIPYDFEILKELPQSLLGKVSHNRLKEELGRINNREKLSQDVTDEKSQSKVKMKFLA